ncbi:hypothetical protein EVA_05890 [gut metagenome]|uniref:Uncharacterized protein n=1 Tax=gut metagenome TaxID=749906 RepID=J9D0D1_9ZZZZ
MSQSTRDAFKRRQRSPQRTRTTFVSLSRVREESLGTSQRESA